MILIVLKEIAAMHSGVKSLVNIAGQRLPRSIQALTRQHEQQVWGHDQEHVELESALRGS